ncbi:hypothetical protein [Leptospira interrogans]|nr:hypothetical protein [Leptospira interrogans]
MTNAKAIVVEIPKELERKARSRAKVHYEILRAIRPDFLTVLLTYNKSLRTKNMKEGFKNQIRFLEIKIPYEIINVSRNQKVEFESIEQRN